MLWVRFLYAYPNRVTQKLLDTLAAHPRLAKYMDMPLQHASRNVLARMKRGSHGDAFLKLLERIRATIRGVSLRTSFIAGFPGETETDFEELCDFVRAANLDWMGVFEYSDVDNANSYGLDEKVDPETITDRRNRLMAIQKKISREKLRAWKGRTATALVEGPSKDNPLVWEARLEGMAPDIDGKLYLTDIELPTGETAETGDVARVEIIKADAYDLIGRVVEILPRRRPRITGWRLSGSAHATSGKTHAYLHGRSASRPRLSYTHSSGFLLCGLCRLCVKTDFNTECTEFTEKKKYRLRDLARGESRAVGSHSDETSLPDLQNADRFRNSRGISFLQRALPRTRSRQLGHREVCRIRTGI